MLAVLDLGYMHPQGVREVWVGLQKAYKIL
jgi:hypothetical protein